MTIYPPPDYLQIHLTGQAEVDFLRQNGTSLEEIDKCLESRKKLRKEWKRKVTNAQNYQRNKTERLARAKEAYARRQHNGEEKEIMRQNRLRHQGTYRWVNSKKLATKEKERRMRKKKLPPSEQGNSGDRYLGIRYRHAYVYDHHNLKYPDISKACVNSYFTFQFLSPIISPLSMQSDQDTLSVDSSSMDGESGDEVFEGSATTLTPAQIRRKIGDLFYWGPGTNPDHGEGNWDWLYNDTEPPSEWQSVGAWGWDLPVIPPGQYEGKLWWYQTLGSLDGSWTCVVPSQSYRDCMKAAVTCRSDLVQGVLRWNDPPSSTGPSLPETLSESLDWCSLQGKDFPLPSFTGEGIQRKREMLSADISRVHEELVSSRTKILELGRSAFSIGANREEYAGIRDSIREAALKENENRMILQEQFEKMDTILRHLCFLNVVALLYGAYLDTAVFYPFCSFFRFVTLRFMENPSKSGIANSRQPATIPKGESHLIRPDYAAIKENYPTAVNYDYSCVYLLTSDTDLSSDEELWTQLENLESEMASVHLHVPPSSIRPTCRPQLFDGQVSGVAFKPKRWYNVYTGPTPGIYTTWGDVSGRVLGVSNARHESFKTYDEALHAWKQNCLGHHNHPNDFIVDTIYTPPSPVMIPQASPPPAHPLTHLPASSGTQPPQVTTHSSHSATSSLSSPHTPPPSPSKRKTARAFFGVDSPPPVRERLLVPRSRSWAVSAGGNTTVVDSETADLIRREAHMRDMPALIREVDSVKEAEEWLSRLDLQSEASSGEPPAE
ncbi:hypothetical protein K435DRAFT_875999 [Dendrothele bispora CBS 962.96]|uniref:Ribonuclease H1 N-terminal domain-containing protein n=1 Tax=Dendrothele bispora (strain CBS 962.96) TaxID=1314807 RepID=A0A4S8KTH8_DENBC|nr:hypothetical protein K435DRAFT_875999 [Dendrothele bispora CBS 962.96]